MSDFVERAILSRAAGFSSGVKTDRPAERNLNAGCKGLEGIVGWYWCFDNEMV